MSIFYSNILSQQEVDTYISIIKDKFLKKNFKGGDETYLGRNCIDFPCIEFDEPIKRLDHIIKRDFGNNFNFSHSYGRIYYNGGVLIPHVDRSKLDITLSVNLYNDTGVDWPMYASDIILVNQDYLYNNASSEELEEILSILFQKHTPIEDFYTTISSSQKKLLQKFNNYIKYSKSYPTKVGDGVAIYATKYLHWRYPLVCDTNKMYVQIFYHWSGTN
jgi:hypothetical protein